LTVLVVEKERMKGENKVKRKYTRRWTLKRKKAEERREGGRAAVSNFVDKHGLVQGCQVPKNLKGQIWQ
jgi:hypothetical protein